MNIKWFNKIYRKKTFLELHRAYEKNSIFVNKNFISCVEANAFGGSYPIIRLPGCNEITILEDYETIIKKITE